MWKIAFFSKAFSNFRKITNIPLGNAARKVRTKFHDATMIRKDLRIGATVPAPRENFSKSQNVENRIFLEKF